MLDDNCDGGSQRSGASGASGLSDSSSRRSDSKFLKKRTLGPRGAEGDETDLLEQRRNVQEGVFACMYTLVRQTALSHWKYAVLKITLEFLMNFAVAFNPTMPVWHIDTNSPLYQVMRWTIWRVPIVRLHGYRTYVSVMYLMAVSVLVSVVGLAWLTLAMRKQEQSKWLRTAATGLHVVYDVMYIMCYAAFFDYFTFMADCNFLHTRKHMFFQDVDCLAMPHLLHMLVSLGTALLFLCVTALMMVASCDLNPVSKGYLSSPAAYARLRILIAKAVFVVLANCVDSNPKLQSIGMLIAVGLICYWNLKEMPFYRRAVNVVWTALWCGVLYTVVLLVMLTYDNNDTVPHRKAMTRNVLYGIFPVILGSLCLCYIIVRLSSRPARKFVGLPPGAKLRKIHRFESVHEVERLARVMRRFDIDGVVDETSAALGETIIKAGMQVFPNSPFLLILYANFMLEVHKDGPAARTQLQLAGKQAPGLVEKYQVFCTNEASKRLKDSQEGGMDMQAYIEFKRNFRAVLRVHREVLALQAELWQMCMRSSLRVAQVDDALEGLDAAAGRAHQVYKRVLERYPANGKLLRCYGKFLEDVRHDQAAAARAYAEASRSVGNALLSLDLACGAEAGANVGGPKRPEFVTSMSIEDDAVVVIDAEGTIMMVSQAVQSVFGYSKSELEGANVSVLMPQPFCQRHPGYMQRYVSSGEPHILDTVRELVALHKDRYVLPIHLGVTKLSGMGADGVFLGVIRPQPRSFTTLRVWLSPNGVILCTDQAFSSAVGFVEGDLVGHTLSSLVSGSPEALESLLESCRAASPEQLASQREGECVAAQLLLAHRFLEPVLMDITVRIAGSDAQRILVLHCRRCDGLEGGLLAVDSHMRIRFASAEVAVLLGYSMRKLASMRLDALLPQPFNTMHAKWLRDPPHHAPPTSCRSGAVVHLLSETGTQVPVRLNIKTDVEAATAAAAAAVRGMTGAGTLYLVQVTKVPAEEMFVEKRLVLTADFTGRVLAVSAPQSTLFGFPGSELLGSCLADSVDLFADWRERSGEGQMQMLLLALLDKEQEMPGTSWRVRVHAPPSAHEGELPPLPGHVRTAKAKLSCSACLQVELDEDGDGGAIADSSTMGALGDDSNNQTSSTEESVVVPSGPSPPSTSGGSRLHITLWRRDLLSGVLELDEDLVVRRASPLAGLITGLPTSALLRKPLSRFLDLPPRAPTWDALVAVAHPHTHAHQHQHVHKKSALKATSDRGSISPVMAFIGPHPDSGTMRLIVQGVQTLGPGGRPKVALTVHPDTLYVGAHANLMRVLRLEGGADDSHRHRRSTDGATSVMCGRSTRAVSPMGVVAVKSKGLRVAEGASGDGDGVGEGTGAGGGAEGEGDANDGDNDAEEAGDDAEPHVSLHRQATSKSEFVEQWVRSLTSQMSGAGANAGRHHHGHHHAHPHQDSGIPQPAPQSRPGSGAHTDSAATAAAPVPAAEPARPDCGRSDGLDGMFALPMSLPQAGASSQLAAIPEAFALPDVDGIAAAGGVKGKRADAEQARRTVSGATVAIDGLVTKLPSRDIVEPPADGRDGNGKVPSGGRKGAEDDDDKSDLASENDASSVGDGSQAASAYSGTSDQTSVTEVVVDARRGRLLRALNKLLLGPSLMTHLNRLRLASYLIIAIMFLAHVISYIAITGLVKKQHGNVNIVYQQARAMDRSQLIVVRILSGTFCETNGVLRVALCANNLNYTIARLVKYINSMESYHQGVYLGLDTSRVTPLAPEVYKIWTTPAVDYQVFLDTQTPEVVTQRAGAWSLGNRFLAAARESLYLLPIHKANYTYHRTFSFLVYNGLGPLFTVYADSLDHLVDAAWESVRVLRTDLIILLIVEALLVQACCTACELLLVQRTETARSLGILAIVGLPGPVLRQLATSEIKVSFDSDDEGDGGSSLAGSDDDARMAPAGGARVGGNGTGGMESRRLQLPAAGLPEPGSRSNTDTRAQEMTTPPDSRMPTAEGGGNKAGTGRSAVSGDEDEPGSDSGNTRKGGLACRTFKALQMQGSKRTATRGSANGRKAADGGSGNQRLRINGKVLLPSRWNISKFTVPFLLWNLAVVLVYVITLAKLNGMQAPLASLNMASRVTYRYTRVRALSVALVISPSMRPLVRQLLSAEISTFESEYNALMYGGVPTSMVNGTFRHEVPAGTFASSSFAQAFFRAKGCMRADPTGCFKPGHRYYEVTHNGIDTMVRRMITEMRLLTDDADADATYNSTRTAFMSAVGPNDLYDGLQQGAQLFVDYSINQFNAVTKMHTILLMVSIGLVLGFFLFVLWPHNARLQRDAARQGALLSLVPAEMDVRAHVRGVLKRNGAAGRGRGGRQGGGNTVETS